MSEDVHLRSIVKYSNYKRFGTSIKITFEGEDITKNGQQPAQGNAPSGQPQTPPPGQPAAPAAPHK
jgi:hypothetical protein